MNGSMLPIDHGFPLRAPVPGYGGNVCVKWLHSISVTTTEPTLVWNQHGLHWNGAAAHPVTVMPMSNMP